MRDAPATILDDEPKMGVALGRRHGHGRLAVVQRIGNEVREHPVERNRVDERVEPGRDRDRHRPGRNVGDGSDELLDSWAKAEAYARHGYGNQVET